MNDRAVAELPVAFRCAPLAPYTSIIESNNSLPCSLLTRASAPLHARRLAINEARQRRRRPALSIIDQSAECEDEEAEMRARLRAELFEAALGGDAEEVEEMLDAGVYSSVLLVLHHEGRGYSRYCRPSEHAL